MWKKLSVTRALAALTLFLVVVLGYGCGREAGPPPPLSAEALPGELGKAFDKAPPELKQVVEGIRTAVTARDYPAAYQGIQYLANAPEVSDDQRKTVARGMLTLTGLLRAAQAQGDPKAAEALGNYQINK
jgi:hypothetical protein